jgi:L-aspartate semialdehyde sulfurtransferase
MAKTYEEINEKIKKGKAVVVTAEEMIAVVKERGVRGAAGTVDVVTTGTFGPMCSSGAFINVGHSKPKMKIGRATVEGVPVFCGLAAVDMYVGATECSEDDPLNRVFPGEFLYGGGHVIEDLIAGKDLRLVAGGYGTDCYPRKELDTLINIKDLNEATLVNPRNSYQNYNCAVNATVKRTIYTYMGILRPNLGNANYCSAGQLSPLLNDPYYRTVGIGTRIFLGGAVGYVYWHGTQHSPSDARNERGVPKGGAGTIAVVGDMKKMSTEFIRGASLRGYGVSLGVGIGIPIPVLDEDMARFTSISDADIVAPVIDYGTSYPQAIPEKLGEVTYAELKSGKITVGGKEIPTGAMSSYAKATRIAETLKSWITSGKFLLGHPVELLPQAESGYSFHTMRERRK